MDSRLLTRFQADSSWIAVSKSALVGFVFLLLTVEVSWLKWGNVTCAKLADSEYMSVRTVQSRKGGSTRVELHSVQSTNSIVRTNLASTVKLIAVCSEDEVIVNEFTDVGSSAAILHLRPIRLESFLDRECCAIGLSADRSSLWLLENNDEVRVLTLRSIKTKQILSQLELANFDSPCIATNMFDGRNLLLSSENDFRVVRASGTNLESIALAEPDLRGAIQMVGMCSGFLLILENHRLWFLSINSGDARHNSTFDCYSDFKLLGNTGFLVGKNGEQQSLIALDESKQVVNTPHKLSELVQLVPVFSTFAVPESIVESFRKKLLLGYLALAVFSLLISAVMLWLSKPRLMVVSLALLETGMVVAACGNLWEEIDFLRVRADHALLLGSITIFTMARPSFFQRLALILVLACWLKIGLNVDRPYWNYGGLFVVLAATVPISGLQFRKRSMGSILLACSVCALAVVCLTSEPSFPFGLRVVLIFIAPLSLSVLLQLAINRFTKILSVRVRQT